MDSKSDSLKNFLIVFLKIRIWFFTYMCMYIWVSQVAQVVKNLPFYAGDLGLIPGLGRSPGGRHGIPLQYSCLESPHGQRSLASYSPWGHKESDTTEQLSTSTTDRLNWN